jgi:protein TonB
MRFFPALFGALAITVALFLFMQGLIEQGKEKSVQLVGHPDVEIFQPKAEEPESEPDAVEEPVEEPVMDAMDALTVSPPTPTPTLELELPALDLGIGDINIQAVGDGWSAPLGSAGVNIPGSSDAQGFVEVVPYNTRLPNVPEVAWKNRINGWVLVAFSVTPEGNTRDVRVLDANPRGVFEEKVIAAVKDWQYRLKFAGKARANVIVTQKVEVRWENYSRNLPNVD